MFVIAGLGNPTRQYEKTRHNVGFVTVDYLAYKHGININRAAHRASVGQGAIAGQKVLLVKPSTFMNLSGECLASLVRYYKLPLRNILVVYDDIDLPVGDIRVRQRGSAGTHNGMRSIIYQLQSEDFPRVRVGIGKPPPGWELADFVLSAFPPEQQLEMTQSVKNAADAAEMILAGRLEDAQKKYNTTARVRE